MLQLNYATYKSLAAKYDTPLYVYSKEAFKHQGNLALAFKSPFGVTVRYAMKANPHKEVLQLFDKMGIHIDASSEYEAIQAVEAGISVDKIILNSQQLPRNFKSFIDKGIFFCATSIHQLQEYAKIAPGTHVAVRLNPGDGSGMCNRVTTGGITAGFGIWHEYIPQALALAKEHNITISRVHTHIGGGTDPDKWCEVARTTLELVKRFPDATCVSLGGGFKVARMHYETSACMETISAYVSKCLVEFEKETGRKMHLEIEPGTFLSATCGVLLSEVIDITDTGADGYTFVRLNTGMNDFLRPTLYGAQHQIEVVQEVPSTTYKDYVVIGHNCESGDLLTPEIGNPEEVLPRKLPEVHIGDFMIIGGAGAYCASMCARGYNSFPQALEVFVD